MRSQTDYKTSFQNNYHTKTVSTWFVWNPFFLMLHHAIRKYITPIVTSTLLRWFNCYCYYYFFDILNGIALRIWLESWITKMTAEKTIQVCRSTVYCTIFVLLQVGALENIHLGGVGTRIFSTWFRHVRAREHVRRKRATRHDPTRPGPTRPDPARRAR